MADEKQHDGPNADDGMGTVFADIPYIPAVSDFNRPTSRRQSRIVFGLVGAAVTGMLVVYLTRPTDRVDPHAPRVVAEVSGMHCPIQCGLRVASALEKLPFVLPGSETANPKTGVVTFAVTSADAVDRDQIRRAIEKAGFGVRAVKMPASQPHGNRDPARTARDE